MDLQPAKPTRYHNYAVLKTYFKFNYKYLMKRKSTWLAPAIFFSLFLTIAGLITLNLSEFDAANGIAGTTGAAQINAAFNAFLVIFLAILGISKAIDLFRDPITDGIEILIASKPLERWQVLSVKAIVFNIYGLILFLFSSFTLLIVAVIFKTAPGDYLIGGLAVPLGAWFGFLFFGTLAVLLSIKFSAKAVFSSVAAIAVFGNIIGTTLELGAPTFFGEKNAAFFRESSSTEFSNPGVANFFDGAREPANLHYYLAKNNFSSNTRTNRTLAFEKLYDYRQAQKLTNIWNQLPDQQWVNKFLLFINPAAAFTKIGSLDIKKDKSDRLPNSSSAFNEVDYNWMAQIKTDFSVWNDASGNQYSLYGEDLDDLQSVKQNYYNSWTVEDKAIYQLGAVGNNSSLIVGFKDVFGLNPLSYALVDEQRKTIETIIDEQLKDATSKQDAIQKIEAVVDRQFERSFFQKFREWEYVDRNASISPDVPKANPDWVDERPRRAEFIYYLAQIVAVNDFFNLKGRFDDPFNNFRQEAHKVQIFNPNEEPENQILPLFFGEHFATRVVQSSQMQMVELIATQRLPLWGLALFWFPVLIGLNGLVVWFYFTKDFK